MRRALLGALFALAGCGGDTPQGIGRACADGNDCELRSNAACIVPWPEGYCTEVACTVGSCPEGARCVTGIEFPSAPYDAFCLVTCQVEGDCRDGYRCVDVSLPERVCAPGNT